MAVILSVVVLAGAVLSAPQTVRSEPTALRAFIVDEARAGGRAIPGAEGRVSSAQDLANALGRRGGPIRLVTDKAEADLVIQVTDRFPKAGASTGSNALVTAKVPLAHAAELGEWNVEAIATAGQMKTRFIGSSPANWKGAAAALAKEIERWTEQNRDRLISSGSRK